MRESSFPSRFFRSRFRSSVSRQLTEVPEVYNHRMIRRKLIKVFVGSLLLVIPILFSPLIFAQREICDINPATSRVNFMFGDSNNGIRGTFHLEAGMLQFDPSDSYMSGFVVIAAETAKTGKHNLDKKVAEILDVSEYTDIYFVPRSYQGSIDPSGESDIQVSGILTLRDVTHYLTVAAHIKVDKTTCAAKVHFIVPYVNWGLKDPRPFIFRAAKDVQVDLTLVGKLSGAHGL